MGFSGAKALRYSVHHWVWHPLATILSQAQACSKFSQIAHSTLAGDAAQVLLTFSTGHLCASLCGDLRQTVRAGRRFSRKDRCLLPLVSDAVRGDRDCLAHTATFRRFGPIDRCLE